MKLVGCDCYFIEGKLFKKLILLLDKIVFFNICGKYYIVSLFYLDICCYCSKCDINR